MTSYRRDIDGLRALAVVPVVLCHAGAPGFSGGFVGVDVFFVISGFLITGVLLGEGGEARVSILDFYNRRIRRIFPALFFMLAAVSGLAAAILLPPALKDYGDSLLATATFWSNIQFFREIGYFAADAAEKPLLHTWSLAVEEQFYIVWPLALWALCRPALRPLLLPATGIGLLASLALCVWWTRQTPEAAFYLAQARAWELLAGALIAIRPVEIASRAVRQIVSGAGLVLIALPVALYTAATPFPGPAALAPVLGALLLIVANARQDTLAARGLSWGPIVFVGLVSYSFYLWHWPLLAYARYVLTTPPPLPWALGLVAVAFAMAVVSWRWIEQPFRRGGAPGGAGRRIAVGAIAMAVAAGAGWAFAASAGFPGRVAPDVLRAQAFGRDVDTAQGECDLEAPASAAVRPACRFGVATGAYRILLWGDSHAEALAPMLRAAAGSGVTGAQITKSACAPLIGVREVAKGERFADDCVAFNRRALDLMAAHPELETVVIAARWSLYAETVWFRREPGPRWFLVDGPGDPLSVAHTQALFRRGLHAAVREVRARVGPDVRIVLVGQAPEMPFNVAECVARARHLGQAGKSCAAIPAEDAERRLRFSNAVLEAVARADPKAVVFRPDRRLCDDLSCRSLEGDTLFYRDYGHLTATAARRLAPAFAPMLRPVP